MKRIGGVRSAHQRSHANARSVQQSPKDHACMHACACKNNPCARIPRPLHSFSCSSVAPFFFSFFLFLPCTHVYKPVLVLGRSGIRATRAPQVAPLVKNEAFPPTHCARKADGELWRAINIGMRSRRGRIRPSQARAPFARMGASAHNSIAEAHAGHRRQHTHTHPRPCLR